MKIIDTGISLPALEFLPLVCVDSRKFLNVSSQLCHFENRDENKTHPLGLWWGQDRMVDAGHFTSQCHTTDAYKL